MNVLTKDYFIWFAFKNLRYNFEWFWFNISEYIVKKILFLGINENIVYSWIQVEIKELLYLLNKGLFWLDTIYDWEIEGEIIIINYKNKKEIILYDFNWLKVSINQEIVKEIKYNNFIKENNPYEILNNFFLWQKIYLKIEWPDCNNFEKYLEYFEIFFKLIKILIWKIIIVWDVKLKIWKYYFKFLDSNFLERYKKFEEKENILFKSIENYNYLFKNWFENYEKNKLIYDVYFSTIENDFLCLENCFLNIVQILETSYYILNKWKKEKYLNKKLKFLKDFTWYKLSNNDLKYITKCRNILSHWLDRKEIYCNQKKFYNTYLTLKLILELFILKNILNEEDFDKIYILKIQQLWIDKY